MWIANKFGEFALPMSACYNRYDHLLVPSLSSRYCKNDRGRV
jgi:hypothetical protein